MSKVTTATGKATKEEKRSIEELQEMRAIITSTLKENIVKFNFLFEGIPKKAKILGSIVKSNHLVGLKPANSITGRILIPDMAAMAKKTCEELKKMRVSKIGGYWDHVRTIQMTLNDGSTCKAGTEACKQSFDFDEKIHICKVDVIFIE